MNNKFKIKENQKEYYKENLDKIKEKKSEYYHKNLDKIKEKKKEYYKKSLDKIKEGINEYRIKNPDKIKKVQREYRMNNPDKIKEIQDEYKKNLKAITETKNEYYSKNLDKIKESQKEYYQNSLAKHKEIKKEYRTKNLDKIKVIQKEYRSNNKVKIKANKKDYLKKNLFKIRERKKEYRLKNKDKIRQIKIQKNPNYIPNYSWNDREQSRLNMESIGRQLEINDLSDWYRISLDQIRQFGGARIIAKFGTLGNALQYIYPEYPWDSNKFSFIGKKSTQRWLSIKLRELLPNIDIIEDFYHPSLAWEKINRSIQFDIWVPEYNLALEYQGEHHYNDLHTAYGTGSTSKMFFERDEEKKKLCQGNGVSLVCIPYWWDRKASSLCSTLNQTHPAVFPITNSPPIPKFPPNSFGQKNIESEDMSWENLALKNKE